MQGKLRRAITKKRDAHAKKPVPATQPVQAIEPNTRFKAKREFRWYLYERKGCCGGLRPAQGGIIRMGEVLTYKSKHDRIQGYRGGIMHTFTNAVGAFVRLSAADLLFLQRVDK